MLRTVEKESVRSENECQLEGQKNGRGPAQGYMVKNVLKQMPVAIIDRPVVSSCLLSPSLLGVRRWEARDQIPGYRFKAYGWSR